MKPLARPGLGIAAIVVTAGCFATRDATVEHLGVARLIVVLLWARHAFQTTFMAALQLSRRLARTAAQRRPKLVDRLRSGDTTDLGIASGVGRGVEGSPSSASVVPGSSTRPSSGGVSPGANGSSSEKAFLASSRRDRRILRRVVG